MDLPSTFKDIAPFLQHPLVLVGFVILLFFGILTALFKAGILPPLPKRTAGDVVKRVINFGFAIALLVILLGFWEHLREGDKKEGQTRGGTSHDSTKTDKHDSSAIKRDNNGIYSHTGTKVYFKITLLVPSDLNDAEILVDGRPADVITRNLTSVIIRMEKREISQKIVVRNSFRQCISRVFVDRDSQLQPCL